MKARQLIITSALLAMTGVTMAQQSTTMTPSSSDMTVPSTAANGVSNDPYGHKRQADADAKAQYKSEKKTINKCAKPC